MICFPLKKISKQQAMLTYPSSEGLSTDADSLPMCVMMASSPFQWFLRPHFLVAKPNSYSDIPNCCWSNHVNPPEVFVLLQTKYKKLRNNPKVVAMLNPTIPTSIFRIYGAKYCFLWFPEGFLLGVWENCFSLGQKRWAPGRLAMAWQPAGRIWVCHQAGRQVGDIYRSTASLNGLWLVVTLW